MAEPSKAMPVAKLFPKHVHLDGSSIYFTGNLLFPTLEHKEDSIDQQQRIVFIIETDLFHDAELHFKIIPGGEGGELRQYEFKQGTQKSVRVRDPYTFRGNENLEFKFTFYKSCVLVFIRGKDGVFNENLVTFDYSKEFGRVRCIKGIRTTGITAECDGVCIKPYVYKY